jgi:hypothetical protein
MGDRLQRGGRCLPHAGVESHLAPGGLQVDTREEHWQHVYSARPSDQVSWFQTDPERSLRLLGEAGLSPST